MLSLKASHPPSPTRPTPPPGTPVHPANPAFNEPLTQKSSESDSQLPPLSRESQHHPSQRHRQGDDVVPINDEPTSGEDSRLNRGTKSFFNPFRLSLVLENRGSVARDHLALERTYLAYVRTSLALSSAGVALVQLFSLTPTGATSSAPGHFPALQFARPLGAVMIIYGLIVLIMGTFRYFRIQHTLPRGVFPTSLYGVATLAFILGAYTTVLFALLVGVKS